MTKLTAAADLYRDDMQLYAANGEQTSALRQYETCVNLLEAELGVPPSEATSTLYERIRSGMLRGVEPAQGTQQDLSEESASDQPATQ